MNNIASRYGRMEGTKQAFEVVPSAGGFEVHSTDEPNKGIVDVHGDRMEVKRSFMARLDAKASEKLELSKGTLAAIALVPAFLIVLFNYGAGALGWARDDEAGRVKMANIERQVEELNRKFDDIQKALQEQAIQRAKVEGYTLGQTDAGATGHKGGK